MTTSAPPRVRATCWLLATLIVAPTSSQRWPPSTCAGTPRTVTTAIHANDRCHGFDRSDSHRSQHLRPLMCTQKAGGRSRVMRTRKVPTRSRQTAWAMSLALIGGAACDTLPEDGSTEQGLATPSTAAELDPTTIPRFQTNFQR